MTKDEFMRQRNNLGQGQGSSAKRSSSVAASGTANNRMTKDLFTSMRQNGQRPWTSTPEEAKARWAGESHVVTLSQEEKKQQLAARDELAELQKQREAYDKAVEEALGGGLDADSWYSAALLKSRLAGMNAHSSMTQEPVEAAIDKFMQRKAEEGSLSGSMSEKMRDAEESARAYEEAQRQLAYARAYRFSTMPEREDFEELSAKGLEDLEERRAAAVADTLKATMGTQYAKDDSFWEVYKSMLLGAPATMSNGQQNPARMVEEYRAESPLDELPTDEWSEEQRKIYGYLRAQDAQSGKNEAAEYGRQINDSLAQSKKEAELQKIAGVGNWGLAVESVAARAAGLLSGADYFNKVLEYAGKGYTTTDPYVTFTDYAETVDSEVARRLNNWSGTFDDNKFLIGGKGLGDVYQLGTSMIDSIVSANLGGELGSLAIFFGKAASSGYSDALRRGADPGQALAYGFAQGTAEAFFEKFSVESLLDWDKIATRSFVENLLVHGGVEASEEFCTSIANTLNDVLILKEKGELESSIRAAMADGLSYEEAAKKVMLETFESWTYDALGGFVSGAGSMSLEQLAYRNSAYEGDARGMIETARALEDKESAAVADRMEHRLDKRSKNGKEGTLTNAEAGKLERSIGQAIDTADRSARVEAVKARLQELGSGEMSGKLAETIVKAQEKKTLSRAETDMLRNSDYAKQVLREFSGFGTRQGQAHTVTLGESKGHPAQAGMSVRATMPGRGEDSAAWARNIGQYRYQTETFGKKDLPKSAKAEEQTKAKTEGKTAQRPVQVPERLPFHSTVSEAEREQLRRSVAALNLGEDAKTVAAAFHGGKSVDSYVADMNAAINLFAANGVSLEIMRKSALARGLSEDQIDAAWVAGRRKYDARMQKAAEQSRKGSEREVTDIKPGRVDYESGATVKGVKYKGVDKASLSKAQKRQIDASAAVAKAFGLELVLFDGEKTGGTQGVYQSGGRILLNVNAGAAIGETLIASTFSHELTHFAEEYGGEAYEELRSYAIKYLAENDRERFEQIVTEKMKSLGLDYDDALSEVIADGCELMLRDTNAPALLARENPSLLQKICDWIGELTEKLRAAFEGVGARHEEARILMKEAQELQKRFDAALAAAVQSRENARSENENARSENENARSENENAAPEGGKERYSIDPGFAKAIDTWDGKSDKTFRLGSTSEALQSIGVKDAGIIWHSRKINKILQEHPAMTKEIIKQVPMLLENPVMVLKSKKSESRIVILGEVYDKNGDLVTAVMELQPTAKGGQIMNMNVVVSAYGKNDSPQNFITQSDLMYVDPDKTRTKRWMQGLGLQLPSDTTAFGSIGSITYQDGEVKINSVPYKQYMQTEREDVDYTTKVPATKSAGQIAYEKALAEKAAREQSSEWDGGVSDRELLREAAERDDASEAVKAYARKANNLEAYQRRLERQQKKLSAEDLSAEEREALAGRIADTQALIEKTNKALINLELRSDMRREADAARERWWSINVGDAVKTSRNLQRENRELKQMVEYFREQAKLTTPENRTVDPADVRRFAKALIKEHGSSVDAGTLAEHLQALGDMLVSNDEGRGLSDRELRRTARAAARAIIDEVYEENADAEELRREIAGAVRSARLQISDELRGDKADFNQWRKANLGRFTLVNEGGTPIDSFYKELAATYGEGMFPTEITAQADMLDRISNLIDGLKGQRTYAYSRYEREEIIGLVADEILETMISGEIRAAETIADRNYRKMQERMLEARERASKAEREAERAGRRADRAEETALRQAREEQKAITREKIKDLRQELNESREAQQTRINIERTRARLSKLLRENSKAKHLPEILRGDIGKFLLSLDTLGPFSAGTKSEARFREEMQEIERALGRIKDSGDLEKVYGSLELSDGVKAMLQNNIDQVRAAIGDGGEKVTRKMGLKELQALEESLNIISTAVSNMNELLSDGEHRFAHMDELAESTIAENADIREKRQTRGWIGKQLTFANLTPYYAFKRFGDAGQEVFRGLSRGWGKMARLVDQVERYAEGAYSADEVQKWETEEHSFKLVTRLFGKDAPEWESAVRSGSMDIKKNAVDVTMTTAQIMSLYCLNKREQARGHIYGAGIRIADYKKPGKVKPITQAEHYFLDLEDMSEIFKTLTDRQKEVCDELQRYMNTEGSRWGNEVSMKLYGVRMFTEEHYFPIRTDSTQHAAKTQDSDRGNLFRLINQSFTKQTVKNANNAIILESIFDVFANHMADMAKYNAMGLPMLDAMRWYNYQAENTSVQQSLQRAFGAEAGKYYTDFIQDLNGTGEGGRGEEVFSRIMSGAKVASVGANIRVALQQPTSIARAAVVIDPKYLAKGMVVKGGREKALKYSGLALWKDLGYFDVNVNRGMREKIKHADGLKEKIQDKSLWLAEKGDQLTWGALWNACELETAEKTKLTGEELMQKTAERFDELILATQVMDSTLTRSDNMRSKSQMLKEFTAFMAEPTLTYNMLLDCWSEFDKEMRRSGTANAVQKTKGKILRTAAVYCCCAALTAIAQAMADAGRDDDDYETWLEKFWQHWTEDFFDNMNPLKLVPILQDLYSMIVEKRDKTLLVLQPIKSGIEAYHAWAEWFRLKTGKQEKATQTTWYGRMTLWGQIYKTLQVFSSASGLPLGAATREFQAGYNTFLQPLLNATYGKFSGKELVKWRTYEAGAKKQIQNAWEHSYLTDEEAIALLIDEGEAKDETAAKKIIYGWELGGTAAYKAVKDAAVSGDTKAYQEAMKAMTDAGYTVKEVQTQVRGAIKQQYQAPESGLKLSKAYCIDYLVRYAGMNRAEATEQAQEWTCYVVTGIDYGDEYGSGIRAAFKDGEIDKWRAIDLLVTYGGKTREAAQRQVENWMK